MLEQEDEIKGPKSMSTSAVAGSGLVELNFPDSEADLRPSTACKVLNSVFFGMFFPQTWAPNFASVALDAATTLCTLR